MCCCFSGWVISTSSSSKTPCAAASSWTSPSPSAPASRWPASRTMPWRAISAAWSKTAPRSPSPSRWKTRSWPRASSSARSPRSSPPAQLSRAPHWNRGAAISRSPSATARTTASASPYSTSAPAISESPSSTIAPRWKWSSTACSPPSACCPNACTVTGRRKVSRTWAASSPGHRSTIGPSIQRSPPTCCSAISKSPRSTASAAASFRPASVPPAPCFTTPRTTCAATPNISPCCRRIRRRATWSSIAFRSATSSWSSRCSPRPATPHCWRCSTNPSPRWAAGCCASGFCGRCSRSRKSVSARMA